MLAEAHYAVLERRRRARSSTRRLADRPASRILHADEFQTVSAIAARIVPQPTARPPIPVAALIDEKLHQRQDGRLSPRRTCRARREAWRLGLRALDAEAQVGPRQSVPRPAGARNRTRCSRACRTANCTTPPGETWRRKTFFETRMAHDIVLAYYAHPTAWSEIGWGGPASPRGYVRMDFDERDPWEAAEVKHGDVEAARGGRTAVSDDPLTRPARTRRPRARRVPSRRLGADARISRDEPVDFVIVGTGAGGGTLACKLAEDGFSVVALDAGPYFRPLEDFASDEIRADQALLDRRPHRRWRQSAADGQQQQRQGGRRQHRAFRDGVAALPARNGSSRAACSATAPTGRSIGARCGTITREVEQALKISGPVTYPWGPHAAALSLSRRMSSTPPRARSPKAARRWASTGPRRRSRRCRRRAGCAHPCVYRGFCVTGCSTNAKQSALVTWIPRALAAGAEIRDLAMVGRIEIEPRRARHRRALSSRGPLALPARAQRRRRRLRDRDAAAAAEFGDRSLSRTVSPTAPVWSART